MAHTSFTTRTGAECKIYFNLKFAKGKLTLIVHCKLCTVHLKRRTPVRATREENEIWNK